MSTKASYPTWIKVDDAHYVSKEEANGVPDFSLQKAGSLKWLAKWRCVSYSWAFKTLEEAKEALSTSAQVLALQMRGSSKDKVSSAVFDKPQVWTFEHAHQVVDNFNQHPDAIAAVVSVACSKCGAPGPETIRVEAELATEANVRRVLTHMNDTLEREGWIVRENDVVCPRHN